MKGKKTFPPQRQTKAASRPVNLYDDVPVPVTLDFATNYVETNAFLDQLRKKVLIDRRRVRLDFDSVETVRPAALLYTAATIMTCRAAAGNKAVTGTYPSKRALEILLQEAGFFDLLGVNHRINVPARTFPLDWIPHVCGTKAQGEKASALEEKIFGSDSLLRPDISSQIYVGVTEAMTNVTQHAYPFRPTSPPWLRNRWWLTGNVNRLRKELLVILCDLGLGIPKTVVKEFGLDYVQRLLSYLPAVEPKDPELIKAAMLVGRTRTGEPHRGKGLKQMRGVIDHIKGGSLHITSGFGDYSYGYLNLESTFSLPSPLIGTIVEWRLPLANILAAENGKL